jgi:type IV pilus assembly protein PilW
MTSSSAPFRILARKKCLGVGIVELLVAVTIGMVLIAGALNVFITSRKTYTLNQRVARTTENADFALTEVARHVNLAGYWGKFADGRQVVNRTDRDNSGLGTPLHTTNIATTDCTAGWYSDVERRIEGLENTNSPYRTTCLPDANYQANTDILVVRHVEPVAVTTGNLAATTTFVRSEVGQAELFVGTTPPGGFSTDAANYLLRSIAFYVSPFSLTVGDGIPALKRVELQPGPEVIVSNPPSGNEIVVSGVENMQVQYGVNTAVDDPLNPNVRSFSANSYVNADNVADWSQVVSVRVWMIVRAETTERDYVNTDTFNLPNGDFTAPGDGFRRVMAIRTIQLRNPEPSDDGA